MSFLRDYEITTRNNEVPKTYHLFSALVTLSTLVSSRVWMDCGIFIARPNLYVVLTGEPGIKKNTALYVARRLINEIDDKIPLSGECQSKEDLVRSMTGHARVCELPDDIKVPPRFHPLNDARTKFSYCPMSVMVPELGEFLGIGAGRMIDFLTAIFDVEDYKHSTIKRGDEIVVMPYLTVLSATVPDWITSRLKDDVITGGFSSRTIFVYEDRPPKRIAFPEIDKEMEDAWDRLVAHGKQLLQVKGPFTWGAGTKEYYAHWYENLPMPEDVMLRGWYNRKGLHALKVSMLISLSEGFDRVIEINHLQMAIELLDITERNLPKVFRGVGRNELFGIANKVVELLERTPGRALPEKFVKKELFREADITEIAKIIAHLVESGKVRRAPAPDAAGKKQQMLILNNFND